jgi:hypothetical protein
MSAQTTRLLVWGLIRCDPPPQSLRRDRRPRGANARSTRWVENVSGSFHAHREPQQSTRFGPARNKSFSCLKDGTFLMRLPCYGDCQATEGV